MSTNDKEREVRLAKALRDNLRRRKDQERARQAEPGAIAADAPAGDADGDGSARRGGG
jgi:hypothetical protein